MAEKNQFRKTLLTAKDLADMGEEGEFCRRICCWSWDRRMEAMVLLNSSREPVVARP